MTPRVGDLVRAQTNGPRIWVRGRLHAIDTRKDTLSEELLSVVLLSYNELRYVYTTTIETLPEKAPQSQRVEAADTPRGRVLDEARELIHGDRNKTYGPPTANFANTAELWTIFLKDKLKDGAVIAAPDVAWLQILLKTARAIAGPKRDHWVDVAGYAACGAETEEPTT